MFWVTPDKTLAERFAESDADKLKAKVAELERKVKELEDDNSASSSTERRAMSCFAKFSRQAQKLLDDAGFDQITPSELHINGVRILLSNRAVECINEQAREAPIAGPRVGVGQEGME